jgi:adenosylcobinamide-GDP ribazoletransferase
MISAMQFIRNQWRFFLTALQFFTRIPVHLTDFQPNDLNQSTRFFPLIGLLVGIVGAFVFYAFNQFLPLSLAVLISMIATILLTGAFHEDGLADAVDGLGGGLTREQCLTIMVDSRIGSFGTIALVMALLTKHQALVESSASFIPTALIVGHALSRFCAVLVMATQDYAKTNGKSKPLATKLSRQTLWIATCFGLIPLCILSPYQLFALVPVFFVWRWFSFKVEKKIGGYTGDCLGAMQQLTEITFYVGLLASHQVFISMNL